MSTTAIILPFIILILQCGLTAWINIAIKHAPDKKTASHDVALIFHTIFCWIFNIFVGVLLIREVSSSEPLTRWAVFRMIFYLGTLFYSLVCWHLSQILSLMSRMDNRQWDSIDSLTKILGKTVDVVKDQRPR